MNRKLSALKEALIGTRTDNPDIRWIERPGWFQAINKGGKTVYQNTVYLSEFAPEASEAEVDAAIHSTIDEYRRLGLSFRWIGGPWTRPDLGVRLLKHGLTLGRMSYGMTCDASRLVLAADDNRIAIERVNHRSFDVWADTYCKAWDIPASGREAFKSSSLKSMSANNRADYLASYNGVPAGTAGTVFLKRSVYLHSSAVLPEFRRKGIFRSLIRERALEGRRRGLELVTIYAFEDTSFPLLQKMGFETACECPQYFHYPEK